MVKQTQPLIKMEVIHPKKGYPVELMPLIEKEVRNALMTQVKPLIQAAQLKRIQNWRSRPIFGGVYRRPNTDEMHLIMMPTGSKEAKNRWLWVSLGTNREGMIYPRRAKKLRFKSYYSATAPGNVYGRYHGRSWTSGVYYKDSVKASSIDARNFETHIIDETEWKVYKLIDQAVDKAIRSYE